MNNTLFGLPEQIRFCTVCVMSNQKPNSQPEFFHSRDTQYKTLHIDESGVCDACRAARIKVDTDWEKRERHLLNLLDQHRSKTGAHDCIVPGSGGKDSVYASHVLKTRYGMHPLTVTWPPILYTEVGRRNFDNWLSIGGFDNVTFTPNGWAHRLLTRLAIINILHPFQTFILGQKNLAPKIALRYNIPLIFYGENEAEYGNPIADNATSLRAASYYATNNWSTIRIAGIPVDYLLRDPYKLSLADLASYLPSDVGQLAASKIEVHYLGYYLKWVPQENYYYAVEHAGFEPNPEGRSEGTYSKYNSLDDQIDGLHYYTTWVKFGLGRASYDAAQEIRNGHLTRQEAVALVRKYDGEFPDRYFRNIMKYLDLKEEEFRALCNTHHSPHLWVGNEGEQWKLRNPVE